MDSERLRQLRAELKKDAPVAGVAVRRPARNPLPAHELPPAAEEGVRSPAQPLDAATSEAMSARFDHDFSGVRVHADEAAAESARAVGAQAYTVGQDVVFGTERYAPDTAEGRQLLAHELTHVVQQERGGAGRQAQRQERPHQDGYCFPHGFVPRKLILRVPGGLDKTASFRYIEKPLSSRTKPAGIFNKHQGTIHHDRSQEGTRAASAQGQ